MDYLATILLALVGTFLMLIILLQRGRGGGLAGAFGGLGGQSAFGTKAGDVFTKITIVLTVIWVALAGLSIWALEAGAKSPFRNPNAEVEIEAPADENAKNEGDAKKPADGAEEPESKTEGEGDKADYKSDAAKADQPAEDKGRSQSEKDSEKPTSEGDKSESGDAAASDKPEGETPDKK